MKKLAIVASLVLAPAAVLACPNMDHNPAQGAAAPKTAEKAKDAPKAETPKDQDKAKDAPKAEAPKADTAKTKDAPKKSDSVSAK
jgi:hypothetical protein